MFHTLSLTTLTTLRDAICDSVAAGAISRSLNAISYQIGSRQLARASLTDLMKMLHEVERAIDAKNGDDIGYASFDNAPVDPDPRYRC